MFLSKWSVQRPIAMSAFIIVLVMIGASLYPKLSIDLLPKMEIPTVLVRCEYQGASPTEIEVEVVKRIEDAVSSLDGIKHVTSLAMEDEARIQLEFNMGTDVDIAATGHRTICTTSPTTALPTVFPPFPVSVRCVFTVPMKCRSTFCWIVPN